MNNQQTLSNATQLQPTISDGTVLPVEDPTKLLDILEQVGKYIVVCKIHYDIIKLDDDFKTNIIEQKL